MAATAIKFQSHYFSNMEDITPTADIISTFLKLFQDKKFLPNIFQEINPGSITPENRIGLVSPNNEWIINITRDRIVIQKNLLSFEKPNLGSIDEFAIEAKNFFKRILKEFPRNGTRISLVTTFATKQISDDKMQPIFKSLFMPPEFYSTNDSAEWQSKMVAKIPIRINEKKDMLNVISTLKWVKENPILYGLIPLFDLSVLANSVLIEFDINTHQNLKEPRISTSSIEEYFEIIIKTQKTLLNEWEQSFNVK